MHEKTFFISTSIPYVNASPHLGHALEFVQADAIARYRRLKGADVFFLTGTDENALKNAQAARDSGVQTQEFVDSHAAEFRRLVEALNLSNTDFIRTSVDERHLHGAAKLWQALKKDDVYKKTYHGLYCLGCEEFKPEKELVDGGCPEHPGKKIEEVEEENYFFRLSNYEKILRETISTDALKIIPESRKNEILRFLEGGEALVDGQLELGPVVEAGAADLLVVETEAKRLDEVEPGASRDAGASDIAGVPVDLRLDQDDVHLFERRRRDAQATASASAVNAMLTPMNPMDVPAKSSHLPIDSAATVEARVVSPMRKPSARGCVCSGSSD